MSATEALAQAVEDLDREHDTSFGLWAAYWEARVALRIVALGRYHGVNQKYLESGEDAWMPSEGFKEISADETRQMRIIRGEE